MIAHRGHDHRVIRDWDSDRITTGRAIRVPFPSFLFSFHVTIFPFRLMVNLDRIAKFAPANFQFHDGIL